MLSRPFRKQLARRLLNAMRPHLAFTDLADALGYSSATIYDWGSESRCAPTDEHLADLREFYAEWKRSHESKRAPAACGRGRK